MNLKEKAQLTYNKLRDFERGSESLPREDQGIYLGEVLSDLADAAERDGCMVDIPHNPTCLQALNVVTQILDWVREDSDLCLLDK